MGMPRRKIEPRMLRKQDAADYCGISIAAFVRNCPVVPAALGNDPRLHRYDVRAIDRWLDSYEGPGFGTRLTLAQRMERARAGGKTASVFEGDDPNVDARREDLKAPALFMKVREAADRLQCSDRMIRKMVDSGQLHSMKVGATMIRIFTSSVDALAAPRG